MLSLILEPVLHLIIAVCLIAAYCALRWHGVDEPIILGLLGGQLGALGVSQVAQQVTAAATTGRPAVTAAPVPPTTTAP